MNGIIKRHKVLSILEPRFQVNISVLLTSMLRGSRSKPSLEFFTHAVIPPLLTGQTSPVCPSVGGEEKNSA